VATVGNLLVLISGSNAPLTAALAKSEAELKAFSGTATGHGATASTGLHTVGLAALGVVGAVAVMGAASVKAAADFQEQMGIINTIAHQTPEELNKTGQAIRGLSTSTGTGLTDLTQGFYDLLSAGVPAAKAMDALRQANTLAIGGLATTAQTVDLITTAINSYSLNTRAQRSRRTSSPSPSRTARSPPPRSPRPSPTSRRWRTRWGSGSTRSARPTPC
jgi:hypothetical protein